jgi:hypothetical protein
MSVNRKVAVISDASPKLSSAGPIRSLAHA